MAEHNPNPHRNHRETAARNYDKLRKTGVPSDTARKIADTAATQAHTALDRRK
jgi:hypothetical protein